MRNLHTQVNKGLPMGYVSDRNVLEKSKQSLWATHVMQSFASEVFCLWGMEGKVCWEEE